LRRAVAVAGRQAEQRDEQDERPQADDLASHRARTPAHPSERQQDQPEHDRERGRVTRGAAGAATAAGAIALAVEVRATLLGQLARAQLDGDRRR